MSSPLCELALERLPIPVLLLDSEDCVVLANAAARAAFGDPAVGTPLMETAPSLSSEELPGGAGRVAFQLDASAEKLASLSQAAETSNTIAHEVMNAHASVSLALRAVARALGEDEVAVLEDLAERLSGVERLIRTALSSAPRQDS